LRFSEEGATVWATDLNETALQALAKENPAIQTAVLDVRDAVAIQAFAKQRGAVDILFNCAGYVHHGTILDCDEDDWEFSFDLNVRAMYRMLRAFLPAMIAAGGGSVINMASVVSVKGVPNRFVYGASKAAVVGLTKAIAADFVTKGIRCNAICPGTVQSPSLDERIAAQGGNPEEVRAAFIARQPMGRLGTVEEIAATATFLAADESAYATGAIFMIDGGMTM
ncbi:MAG TPA: NAD(P)-dependent oxidoreductase, partial [Deltaproteobacteria bacterium]|nr:NAD(P)-dependent oxidoreductase [Deltaproteobacteria bacterium]